MRLRKSLCGLPTLLPDRQAVQGAAVQPPTAPSLQPAWLTRPVCMQLGMADAADRVFVGGLPYFLTDEQCKQLLSSIILLSHCLVLSS